MDLQEKMPENRGETLPPTPRTTNLGTAVGVSFSRLVQPRSTPCIRYLRHTHQFLDSLPRGTATAVPRFLALGSAAGAAALKLYNFIILFNYLII
jgi:hypothetical protein